MLKRILLLVVAVGILGGGGYFVYETYFRKEQPIYFRSELVKEADLVRSISAVGTVEPEELINVGAQVAGQILSFGTDCDGKPVNYGSRVAAGMILAKIDEDLYRADLRQAKAALDYSSSQIRRAEAELRQMEIQLEFDTAEFERAKQLIETKSISKSAFDGLANRCKIAENALAIGAAALSLAKSNYQQNLAAVERAERNVKYCTIVAPVNGVVIDRRVNVGQTVVSSMTAPSLFLLAKDLKKMQVWVAVNEADIGGIVPGVPVEFTIDAFPGETFIGKVVKIRLNAAMIQNVVTYTVEIETDNSSGRLLPYLTANVRFLLERKDKVPTISNAALRWQPPANLVSPENQYILNMPPPSAKQEGFIWIIGPGGPDPVKVKLGMTDGVRTEILANAPTEKARVINGILSEEASKKSRVSPFLPQANKRL